MVRTSKSDHIKILANINYFQCRGNSYDGAAGQNIKLYVIPLKLQLFTETG